MFHVLLLLDVPYHTNKNQRPLAAGHPEDKLATSNKHDSSSTFRRMTTLSVRIRIRYYNNEAYREINYNNTDRPVPK